MSGQIVALSTWDNRSELLTTAHVDAMRHVSRALRVRFISQAWAKYPESMQAMLATMLWEEPADGIKI
jgi:hypothetical protein